MLSNDAALVVDRKLVLTIWAAEFLALHFLSQLLIRWLLKSFLGHSGAFGKAIHVFTYLDTLFAG